EVRGVLGTSADASYVYFAANGIPDGLSGSPNGRGESAEVGGCAESPKSSPPAGCNLYLAHDGEVSFIARLEVGGAGGFQTDAADWVTTLRGIASVDVDKAARVSSDGKALLFRSQRRLTSYENEGTPEFYLYRVGVGMSCVSCNPTGEAPGRQPKLGSMATPVLEPGRPASTLSRNLSADGQRVFFETTDPLVVEDTNGAAGCPAVGSRLQNFSACSDVYEWEAPGSGSCTAARAVAGGGCIYLLSTGKGSEPALIADASADGKDVYLFSRSRLAGQDGDSLQDVYDVRVDGGLASQNQAPPPVPCEGEGACRPAATPPPPSPSAATGSFVGPPNPKPSVKHKKHKHKKHHHKKRKRHNHSGQRARRGGLGSR
ncbi:MAG TPA: hypothetical protein VLK37_03635, partial [Solirubrobacterales bacterium]|nr:hypothetical protein [Solirubrobacterales bacterium]